MRKGFSLVELSIVLVILGLLVGGILAGQSLIRASELRAVSTEYSRYVTALQSFRDKYFYLPGDMVNATSFWGSMTGCNTTSAAGSGTQTCNGTGDGKISLGAAGNQNAEAFTFWQHLANAGLIEGTYTGIAGAGAGYVAIKGNVPKSKIGGAYWQTFNYNQSWSGANIYDGNYTYNFFEVGNLVAASSPEGPELTPPEAWNVDTKIDDGRPAYGKMRERWWDDCTNATSSANLNSDYLLNSTAKLCVPMIEY